MHLAFIRGVIGFSLAFLEIFCYPYWVEFIEFDLSELVYQPVPNKIEGKING